MDEIERDREKRKAFNRNSKFNNIIELLINHLCSCLALFTSRFIYFPRKVKNIFKKTKEKLFTLMISRN